MAYTINRWSGPAVATVSDGTVNESLDVKLIGKNYAGYGELQNENTVHLLENFAGPVEPPKAISGQLWFNTNEKKIQVYTGDVSSAGTKVWKIVGGADVKDTEPQFAKQGDLWLDTFKSQLKVRTDKNSWLTIGPQTAGTATTQMVSRDVIGTPIVAGATEKISYPIIAATVNDEVVYVISRSEFNLDTEDPDSDIPGFTKIKKGLTLAYTDANGKTAETQTNIFWGSVSYAENAGNAEQLNGISADQFVRASAANFSVLASFVDDGFKVGEQDDLYVFVKRDGATRYPVVAATDNTIEIEVGYTPPRVISETGTVGTITGTGPWTAIITDLSTTTGFNLGDSIFATPGTGALFGGNPTSVVVSDKTSTTIRVTITNGTTPIAGTITNVGVYGPAPTVPFRITQNGIIPGANNAFNLGSTANRWTTVYSNRFDGTATVAEKLVFVNNGSTLEIAGAVNTTANTIAVRDGTGDLYANNFYGVSEKADLLKVGAEYLGTSDQGTANTIAVRTATGTLKAAFFEGTATSANSLNYNNATISPSTSSTPDTLVVRDAGGVISASGFSGNGSALTSLSATSLTSGTVPVARLTGTYSISITGSADTAAKANTLKVGTEYKTASMVAGAGTIVVRDLSDKIVATKFAGNGAELTNLNASQLTTGTIPSARLAGATYDINITGNANTATTANTATNANNLRVAGDYRAASTSADANTIAARTADGDLYARIFNGTATLATNADNLKVGSNYFASSTAADGNTIVVRNSTGDVYANVYYGVAQSAQYADLAENYLADAEYEIGTVVAVGGTAEVTACASGDRAIGVVSANPAYLMNSELNGGTAIALKGRVPVKVTGPVKKGNRLVAFENGTAHAVVSHVDVFAIALESSDDQGVKLIEAIIL